MAEDGRLASMALGRAALVVALAAGMASNVLFLAAFQFRLDWFLEPARVIGAGDTSAELLRWAAALDLVGYYLASGVLAYALWRLLRPRNPIVADLATIAALSYALAGGIGAAVLSMVGPMLMNQYGNSTVAADQAIIATHFGVLLEVVWRSIWQFLDGLLIAAWWLGVSLLVRADHAGLARLSLVLAGASSVGVLLNLLGFDLARDAMLGVVFSLWSAWWIWLLWLFRGRTIPFAASTT
jgi:hypothetical protein